MKYGGLKEKVKQTYIKTQSKFWKRIYKELGKPSNKIRNVNLFKINKYAKDGETIFVPGKVLSVGEITKKITLVAFDYSEAALKKLKNVTLMDIEEMIKKNPKAKKVRILG